jgi:hypothetical protein
LSLEAKENYDNPECGEQSFQEKRKFLDYISEKRCQNSEDLFSQLDKQFDRAEEAFENCQRTSNMPPRSIIF